MLFEILVRWVEFVVRLDILVLRVEEIDIVFFI